MRVLVLGAGAVGTTLAAFIANGGHQVTLWLRAPRVSEYQGLRWLRVDHASGRELLSLPRPPLSARPDLKAYDALLICLKHEALAQMLTELPDKLPESMTLLSTLNGVGVAEELAQRFVGTPVIAVTVMFNARLQAPLHSTLTTRAKVDVGSDDPRWVQLFATGGLRARAASDTAVWGKLLINLNNALCALTHTTFREVLSEPSMRRCFVMVMDEAVAILRHAGQRFDLTVPMSYGLYRRFILHGGKLPWWVARLTNGLTDSAYPSMVADVEAGRITEVQQLNGAVVELGRRLDLPTPANARVVALIQRLQQRPAGTPPAYLTPADLLSELRAASAHARRM